MLKRGFDVVVSALLLLGLFWLLGLVALLVRTRLGSPVLFRQTRIGRRGVPFTLVKFRTMRQADGTDGRPLPDAERLTPFGLFLRRTSLDELPELWNVLRGEMSLVGPRPLLPEYLPRYTAEQARRHEVRPGITGLAQVSGRNALSWEEQFRLDVAYVDHHSLAGDLGILLRTLVQALRGTGVSAPGQATREAFEGSEKKGER